MMDLGFVYYWHLHDYKSAAATFERASELPGAPSWLRPLAAVTLAEGGHRDASRALWQQLAQSDEPWLRDSAKLRLAQLDAMDTIDSLQAPRQGVPRRASGRAGDLGSSGRGATVAGDPARFRRARRSRSIRPPARSPSRATSKLFPLPGQIQAPALMEFPPGFAQLALVALRPVHRQLSQRLHLPAAARRIGRAPAVALPGLRPVARLVGQHSRRELHRPPRALPHLPAPDFAPLSRSSRRSPPPSSWLHWYAFGPTPLLFVRLLFACALIVLFAIDLEHQILPNVITLPGIVIGFVCSCVAAAGPAACRSPASRSAAGCSGGLPRLWFRLRKVEAMGFGDVKMLAMVGAFLGVKMVVLTFVLSSMIGGVVGVALLATRRADMATKVPVRDHAGLRRARGEPATESPSSPGICRFCNSRVP